MKKIILILVVALTNFSLYAQTAEQRFISVEYWNLFILGVTIIAFSFMRWQIQKMLLSISYILFLIIGCLFIPSAIPLVLATIILSMFFSLLQNIFIRILALLCYIAISIYVVVYSEDVQHSVWLWVLFSVQMLCLILSAVHFFFVIQEHCEMKKRLYNLLGKWITHGGGGEAHLALRNNKMLIVTDAQDKVEDHYLKFIDGRRGESNGFFGLKNFTYHIRPNILSNEFPQIVFKDREQNIKAIFDIESTGSIEQGSMNIGRKNVFDDDRFEEHIGTTDMGNVKITGYYSFSKVTD